MPSPSMTGRPACAAVMIGSMALEPPISAEIVAAKVMPLVASTARMARRHSSPCSNFSLPTSGAPIPPTSLIQASSGSASSGQYADAGAFAEQFARAQHADIGAAAAAGAEQGRADGQRVQIAFLEQITLIRHGALRRP